MMLLLMLIMMLKFCVKESSNLIGLENFGAAGFFIRAGLGLWSPCQSESDQISPDSPPFPHQTFTFTKFLHYYYYLKLEIRE